MQVLYRPHDVLQGVHGVVRAADGGPRGVAVQVEFERQTLKPVFHLIGYRLWV
jgi:hypothetical protein